MRDAHPRSRDLVAEAARMYFLDGRSQTDIARALGTSRSNISRMLRTAPDLGIVEIRIQDEHGRDTDLEQALTKHFDIGHVRVAVFRPHRNALAATGALAAEWLEHTLRDGQTLALSWGTTMQALASAVAADEPRRVEIVPLVGGLPPCGSVVAGHESVCEMAARLGATYQRLRGPAFLHSDTARDTLLAEPSIGRIVARARSADIAMVGIGAFGSDSTTAVLDGLGLTAAQHRELLEQCPVGTTCSRFYDVDGKPIHGVVHDRVLAVDLDDLRRIPTVVGVAAGADKAPAVLAAIRGGIISGLIVDAGLAHSMLTAVGAV